MKKIILVEPNPFHNEVLPGIVRYFSDLGYLVDVYIRQEMRDSKVFSGYQGEVIQNYLDIDEICHKLKSNEMREYDFLFLSSMEYKMNGKVVRFLDVIGSELVQARYGVLGIYHTTSHIDEFADYQLLYEGRLFCLSEFQIHDYNLKTLNPHYFGQEAKEIKGIKQKKEFIVVGSAAGTEEISSVLAKMKKEERKNIRINWVGGKKTNYISNSIYVFTRNVGVAFLSLFLAKYKGKRCIRAFGYVPFSKLYRIMNHSDYVLVMINDQDIRFRHYLTYSTSGIKQLILGFHKPCLIQREVADIYGLSDSGILYDREALADGLRTALLVNQNDYTYQCECVNQLEKRVYLCSLENLRASIRAIMNREMN